MSRYALLELLYRADVPDSDSHARVLLHRKGHVQGLTGREVIIQLAGLKLGGPGASGVVVTRS